MAAQASIRPRDREGGVDLFGLTFRSSEIIPGLTPSRSAAPVDAILIEFGATPRHLADVRYEDETVQASDSEYLFSYPGVLRLYVEGDRRIVIERLEDCDPVRLWTIVFGVGSSIAGFRRGFIPLHASSVLTPGGCIAMAGQSGAGKSTLAASLVDRGFGLFADDLCLVQFSEDGTPLVGRGLPEVRLYDDAVAALDWTDIEPFAVQPNINKSVFRRSSVAEPFAGLRRLYALRFAGEDETPGIHRLEGVEAMQALVGCLRMRTGLLGVGLARQTFERLAAISERVEMYRFVRPRDHDSSAFWLDHLVEHFDA